MEVFEPVVHGLMNISKRTKWPKKNYFRLSALFTFSRCFVTRGVGRGAVSCNIRINMRLYFLANTNLVLF